MKWKPNYELTQDECLDKMQELISELAVTIKQYPSGHGIHTMFGLLKQEYVALQDKPLNREALRHISAARGAVDASDFNKLCSKNWQRKRDEVSGSLIRLKHGFVPSGFPEYLA